MKRQSTASKRPTKLPANQLLSRLTLKFFSLPRFTTVLWLTLTIFGLLSYTLLLRREGFPTVQIPIAVVNGTYFVNDPAKVDNEAAKPIADIARKNPNVSKVMTSSRDNFFSVVLQYKAGVDAKAVTAGIETDVAKQKAIPSTVRPTFSVPIFGVTGGDVDKIDLAVSFYAKADSFTTAQLVQQAEQFANDLEKADLPNVATVSVKNPIRNVTNPSTGQTASIERSFDRYGIRQNNDNNFYSSVLITVAAKPNVDVIKLDKEVRDGIKTTLANSKYDSYAAEVSASFAPAIVDNISELQKVLLEGLIAVLIIGSIVIATRASVITLLSMITVILTTVGLLYLIGYTLNVITLFGLILGLSLIVDDTIIMVEAIEAARRKSKTPQAAISLATRKVSRAMVAATVTAALCFLPLALVGGVLGSFIRAIPITIIASLFISLAVALIFIPLFARFLLLTKQQFAKKYKPTLGSRVELWLANGILKPMLWANHSRHKLVTVGITAVIIAFGFIGAGVGLSQKVAFNIFPPTKDTNGIIVSLKYPSGTDIPTAQRIAAEAEAVAGQVIGDNFVQASYYANGSPQAAAFQVELIPYGNRKITSPQLIKQLRTEYNSHFSAAQVSVAPVDLGPPAAAFTVQINAKDRAEAYRLSDNLKAFLNTKQLKRIDGSTARFTDITVSSQDEYIRSDKGLIVQLNSGFDATDTTTLVTLAQTAIKAKFSASELSKYNLPADAISFDLGQETENQDSFKTLAITFPLLLLAIYLLLIVEFRSLLQPLLIFMALPFSIFGLMLGLFLTDNAISFFASLGFFALIGLSIKNTILLTDFANQARASGMTAVESAAAAVQERFRPLVATSLTAICSLVPLAITSPFWQSLAVVLIFGLASSTILVLLVFPYFYLGVEYLRVHISRRLGLTWVAGTLAATFGTGVVLSPSASLVLFMISLLTLFTWALLQKPYYAVTK